MLPYRQVHLDFHTSEKIPGIGSNFSRENFVQAMKTGHINSITLFAKCHHGWSYHPTKANVIHPNLDFDLLGQQLEICRELNIRAQIYVSAGFDEKFTRAHSDCILSDKTGTPTLLNAAYHRLCLGSPYLDVLTEQIEEVMALYGEKYAGTFDGVFMDIVLPLTCYCQHCLSGMEKRGLNPENSADAVKYARWVYLNYVNRINATVHKYAPDMPVFHNGGHIPKGDRELLYCNTKHLELESLPTGGWGYDHFPLSAAYARTVEREFLGMTGKFHRSWGEFGGYKHPNALRYEMALAIACGAKCSIGDQLHPDGEFDMATYRCIGQAYSEIEQKEPWLTDAKNISEIALLSYEACSAENKFIRSNPSDAGANRILLEGHYLYDVIDDAVDFSQYKLLILPDKILLNQNLKQKLENYLSGGGRLLLSGTSGTQDGKFALDFGMSFEGNARYVPSYLLPNYELYPNGVANYVMYSQSFQVSVADPSAEVIARRSDPYFNRGYGHFCSHRHTPNDKTKLSPAVVKNKNVAYIGWEIFSEYAQHGSLHLKSIVCDLIDRLLGTDKIYTTSLGSYGIVTLTRQKEESRYINHLLYAVPKKRGDNIEIIEDILPVYHTDCTLKLPTRPRRVYTAPDGKDLPFTFSDGILRYSIGSFACHCMVVIDL